MATQPTTVNTSPIGIIYPIQGGNSGYFDQSFDTLTQTKSNIFNLLNTRRGERRMQPTFGSRLWNLVFEQNIDTLKEISENVIREDIVMWIPNVTVLSVQSNIFKSDQSSNDADIYMLKLSVVFMLNMTKQTDTVEIVVNNIIV
jgi:phage baseplate assembly protein W